MQEAKQAGHGQVLPVHLVAAAYKLNADPFKSSCGPHVEEMIQGALRRMDAPASLEISVSDQARVVGAVPKCP